MNDSITPKIMIMMSQKDYNDYLAERQMLKEQIDAWKSRNENGILHVIVDHDTEMMIHKSDSNTEAENTVITLSRELERVISFDMNTLVYLLCVIISIIFIPIIFYFKK